MSSAWSNQVVLSTEELLEAHSRVWKHNFSYINTLSLIWAVELNIPEIIHKHSKPMTLCLLVDALGINKVKSFGIHRVMRMLVHSKVFTEVEISNEDKTIGYWLTPASRILLKNEPLSMAPFAMPNFHHNAADPLHHLVEWFRDDSSTAFETLHGKTLWEKASEEPHLNQMFNEGMASDSRILATVLVKDFKPVFEGLKSMVDLAGGMGVVARSIAAAFPALKCVVLDLPHVVAGLEGYDNVTFVGGDMFKFIPSADAVFLKWILHNWSDEECVKILKKCKEAIPSKENGGKLIIVEMVIDDQKVDEKEAQLLFDLAIMSVLPGKQRTEKEWTNLFFEAGFTSYTITSGLGLRSLIQVYP